MKKIVGFMLVVLSIACIAIPKANVSSSGIEASLVFSSGTTDFGESKGEGKSNIVYTDDPHWKVIFVDLFDNNSNKWDLGPYEDKYISYEASIEDGVYKETLSAKPSNNYQNAGFHPIKLGEATDFYVSVTGMINSKFKNSSWGIGFMADEDYDAFIHFGVLKDSYSLYRHNKDAYIVNEVLEAKKTSRIIIGEMNTLELKKDGNYLEYFINGKLIAKYNLSKMKYPGKNVYLYFMVDEGASATFTIDNLLVESKQ